MKILSTESIRKADAETLSKDAIQSIELMERAALACTDWIEKEISNSHALLIVCGKGKNGGDGLAIARILAGKKYKVRVCVLENEHSSEDQQKNLIRLKEANGIETISIHSSEEILKISLQKNEIIIDAIFGSGLNRIPEGKEATAIQWMNRSGATIVSIDLPSGLYCDQTSIAHSDKIVKARHTLCFELPKLCFMFPENAVFVGEWHLIHIGLNREFIEKELCTNYFFTGEEVIGIFKKRRKFDHKGNFGHALLVAGSKGHMGAAVLSARACLRSGVGLLTVHVPKSGLEIIQTAVPEAMAVVDSASDFFSEYRSNEKINAIGVGPGLGTDSQTAEALKILIQETAYPFVLDADALNILSENKTWFSFLPASCILTPHLKEFERMAGKASDDFDRNKKLREFALRYKAFVILKGAHTCVAYPDGTCHFNSSGNPGMATGGSGDVLTGILTALLAQGYSAHESAIMGVYIHGLAGDLAAKQFSMEAMTASDLVENLGQAFQAMTGFVDQREK